MARKTKKPTDMSLLFNSASGTLAQLTEKTNYLTVLNNIIRKQCADLPDDVWKIANFKEKTIVIEVKSAAWSQRLQFERNIICQALAEQTNNTFTHIAIKIMPASSILNNKPVKQNEKPVENPISNATAAQLLAVAKTAPKGLKQKIEKLAAHAKPTNKP